MTAGYSFDLSCPLCGAPVGHCVDGDASMPIWRRHAVCECTACLATFVVQVELIVSRRPKARV